MDKCALITGVNGQDGAYLAQHLLELGYRVIGGMRRSSTPNFWRLDELGIAERVEIVPLDVTDASNCIDIMRRYRPTEVYNLAAQSFVEASFHQPYYTLEADGSGPLNLLEAIRLTNQDARFYQASTSELYGKVQEIPQTEHTPFYPRSPYAAAKLYGHWITINHREAYGMHASSGILFNHESPLRGPEFVTRKITMALASVAHGQKDSVMLGNINAKRDWGFAGDYVKGMHLMLQQSTPDDFVLATNETHTVREFATIAASHMGIEIVWEGEGLDEVGINRKTGAAVVKIDKQFFRPSEVDLLLGNPQKATDILGWTPSTTFPELVEMMAKADFNRIARNGL